MSSVKQLSGLAGNRFIAAVPIRVIAGRYGGRRLRSREAPGLRPTTDRVRESIFNMLVARFEFNEVRVLDLFAGTGALGIEALSRGAASCDFVERSRRTAGIISSNIGLLGIGGQARVLVGDAINYAVSASDRYGLILADPPYASNHYEVLARIIADGKLLVPQGIFVLEHPGGMPPPEPEGFAPIVKRSFGDTGVALYRQSTIAPS